MLNFDDALQLRDPQTEPITKENSPDFARAMAERLPAEGGVVVVLEVTRVRTPSFYQECQKLGVDLKAVLTRGNHILIALARNTADLSAASPG